jgi:hypothetical protein
MDTVPVVSDHWLCSYVETKAIVCNAAQNALLHAVLRVYGVLSLEDILTT